MSQMQAIMLTLTLTLASQVSPTPFNGKKKKRKHGSENLAKVGRKVGKSRNF